MYIKFCHLLLGFLVIWFLSHIHWWLLVECCAMASLCSIAFWICPSLMISECRCPTVLNNNIGIAVVQALWLMWAASHSLPFVLHQVVVLSTLQSEQYYNVILSIANYYLPGLKHCLIECYSNLLPQELLLDHCWLSFGIFILYFVCKTISTLSYLVLCNSFIMN